MANLEGSGSSSPPNHDSPSSTITQDEAPRQRRAPSTRGARLNLGLSLDPAGQRRLSVQPQPGTHQYQIWPHMAARVAPSPLTLPPPLWQRGPAARSAPLPLIKQNYKWKCCVCDMSFNNMHALNGHMGVHKDRGWRGTNPPPGYCKPIREPWRPLQGLHFGGSHYGNYNSYRPRTGFNLGVTSCFEWKRSGLDLGRMQQLAFPRRVLPQAEQSGNTPLDRGQSQRQGQNEEVELDRRTRLGKRPMYPEGETSGSSKRLKRSNEGPVPDLNLSPPGPDEADDDQGEADGDAAA